MLSLSMLFCQIPLMAHADSNVTEDFQTWQLGTIQGHLTKRILGYFDTQNNEVNLTDKKGNSTNNNTHQGQLLVRPAIGFQVTKGWSIWQGYGWTPSYQPQFRNEHQMWEQILYQHRFKYFSVSDRTRLEFRWIQDTNGETAVRLRNQLRLVVPLGKTRWALVAFDEPFYNLNTVQNGPRSGINQNWAFVGIERRLTNNMNLDIGYLNNYVRNFRPVPDRVNNVIFVSLGINTPGTGFDMRRHSNAPARIKSSMVPTVQMQDRALIPTVQPNLEIAPIAPVIADAPARQKDAALAEQSQSPTITTSETSPKELSQASTPVAPAKENQTQTH